MRLRSTWCGAADAQSVGRARTNHWIDDQRTISPVRAAARPPSRANRASERYRRERIHCLDRSAPGTPANAIPTERIRRPSWWERNRTNGPRTPSQGTASDRHRVHQRWERLPSEVIMGNARGRHPRERHPTVIASISAGNDCPRRSSWGTPADANMAGGSARPSGVVPPNQRMQPDAVPASEIVPMFRGIMEMTAVPIESAARLMRQTFGGKHSCALFNACDSGCHARPIYYARTSVREGDSRDSTACKMVSLSRSTTSLSQWSDWMADWRTNASPACTRDGVEC